MRHSVKTNRLDRFSSLRKATIISLARALLINQSIRTTHARAKASSPLVEQLITLAKEGSLSSKRKAFSVLQDHKLVSRLFSEIVGLFENRSSGYTRVIKLGKRRGDDAQMAILELTEKSAVKEKKPKKAKAADEHGHLEHEHDHEHDKETEEKLRADEEKPHASKEEKSKVVDKKAQAPKKFLGNLRKLFKKERDSL